MKITAKQYALSLFESIDGKKEKDAGGIIKIFFQLLVRNNQTILLNEILKQFINVWNKEKGIVEAEVISAKDLDKNTIKLLSNHIADLTKAKEVVMKQKVDKDVLGGVVIRYEDQVLDGSLKTRIKDLEEQMIK